MLPNLVVIGAAKCGTTSLHNYLDRHPEVSMSHPKELRFFAEEVNWDKGIHWYERHFQGNAKVFGESSPVYTNYPRFRGIPERMHSVIPDARLIFMVRDPIERLLSHYRMERARGGNRRSLAEAALRHHRTPYVWQSMYWMQLCQYLDYFPISRILIVTQEELARDRRATLRKVFRYLGVDESFVSPEFDQAFGTSDEREQRAFRDQRPSAPVMTPDQRERLIEHLRPDAAQLRAHTGLRFEGWSI